MWCEAVVVVRGRRRMGDYKYTVTRTLTGVYCRAVQVPAATVAFDLADVNTA